MSNLVIYKDKPHVIEEHPFGWMATPANLPFWATHQEFAPKMPKIPYALFRQMVAWHRNIVAKHDCEAHNNMFLIDGQWYCVPCFQENTKGSMTVDVDFNTDENKALLADWMDKSEFHATLHNHVKIAASQSGTDSNDEKNLYGPHITIGHLHQQQISYHGRFSAMVNGKHQFIPCRFSSLVDIPIPDGGYTEATLAEIEKAYLNIDSSNDTYPKEWDDRFTVKAKPTNVISVGTKAQYQGGYGYGYTGKGSYYNSEPKDPDNIAKSQLDARTEALQTDPLSFPYGILLQLDYTGYTEWLRSIEKHGPIVGHALAIAAEEYQCIGQMQPLFIALKGKKERESVQPKKKATSKKKAKA